MSRIKLDSELIKFISLFQKITRVSPRDCIEDDSGLMFIIPEIDVSRAIGKSGANVKKIEEIVKRKVKIVGYNDDVLTFIKNIVFPYRVKDITQEEGVVTITPPDSYVRGQLIGRSAKNLRATEEVAKRYFDIKEIKVR